MDCAAIEDVYGQGTSRMRYLVPFSLLITALFANYAVLAADDLSFALSLKEHKFTPSVEWAPWGGQI